MGFEVHYGANRHSVNKFGATATGYADLVVKWTGFNGITALLLLLLKV